MIVKPIPAEDCFELVEPLVFWVDKKRQEVPPGFRFRGSVPRLFWTAVVTPYDPKCLRGFCIHDYLYEAHICSRKSADLKLKTVIISDGLNKDSAETIYFAVDKFGKRAWKKAGKVVTT
jgi:hypothetical protein